jgi:hypothetical protein
VSIGELTETASLISILIKWVTSSQSRLHKSIRLPEAKEGLGVVEVAVEVAVEAEGAAAARAVEAAGKVEEVEAKGEGVVGRVEASNKQATVAGWWDFRGG